MKTIHNSEHEIELFDLYSEVLDAYRQKINKPQEKIGLVTYRSEDSQVAMYLFDQESYQKFKDHVTHIPQTIRVRLYSDNEITEESITGKVLVVKSAVNGKIHEVPIIKDWYYMDIMIKSIIPKYFFPCQFVYEAPGHHLEFRYNIGWEQFYAFATHEDNRDQRYFEVSAGKGSIKEQILSFRRDYANLVLPLMHQHQAVFLDQSLAPEEKLEKMIALTKQMADINSGTVKHRDIEYHLRRELHLPENAKLESQWRKLYDLEQTLVREVEEGEWNGNGTYWNNYLIKTYNTDSTEMLPILERELLCEEYQH